jgi:hypothetical protein
MTGLEQVDAVAAQHRLPAPIPAAPPVATDVSDCASTGKYRRLPPRKATAAGNRVCPRQDKGFHTGEDIMMICSSPRSLPIRRRLRPPLHRRLPPRPRYRLVRP